MRTMHMLSRSCMGSMFSWRWSLPSCFCANLWISLETIYTCRSLWRSLFLMYQGALTMCLSTLFWNRCIMSILLWCCNPRGGYRMSIQVLVFVCIKEVCYEGTVRSSVLSANTFFGILGPVPLVSLWHGLKPEWNAVNLSKTHVVLLSHLTVTQFPTLHG